MLTSEQVEQVRTILSSSAWNDVMKPVLMNRAHTALKALVLDSAEREGDYKGMEDTAIKARIRECEWMLSAWVNEVAVHDHNRRRDELDRQTNGSGEPATERR